MADDVNKIKKWIKKWQKNKVDVGAGEEKPHTTDTAENLRQAADKVDVGAGEEKPHTTDTAENLRQAADKVDVGAGEEKPHTTDTAENLRQAADKVDVGAGEEKPHTTDTAENLRQAADKVDVGAGEEKPHTTDTAENLRQAADKVDVGAGEEKPHTTDTAENLREAEENLREEAAKVDEYEGSGDTMPPEKIVEGEPAAVKWYKGNPKIIEKGRVGINLLARKPIVTTLVIVAIVLGGFLLYSQIQLTNQSYKIENFNAAWNQSLADLRSGNTSLDEYCINRVHDEELCNRFMNLQYMN